MDTWNPILAETHIKPVPAWQIGTALTASVAAFLIVVWLVTVVLFSWGA